MWIQIPPCFSHTGKSPCWNEQTNKQTHVARTQNSLNMCAGCLLLLILQIWKGDWPKGAHLQEPEWYGNSEPQAFSLHCPRSTGQWEANGQGGWDQRVAVARERVRDKSLGNVVFSVNFYVAYPELKCPVEHLLILKVTSKSSPSLTVNCFTKTGYPPPGLMPWHFLWDSHSVPGTEPQCPLPSGVVAFMLLPSPRAPNTCLQPSTFHNKKVMYFGACPIPPNRFLIVCCLDTHTHTPSHISLSS